MTSDWVRSKFISLAGPQKPLLATVKRWKLAWFGHVTCPDSLSKTILQGTLEGGGDAVVGSGNAGWTTSKGGHPCPCQNCSQPSPTEKTGRGPLLNRPSCPPDDPIGKGTELNWTERRFHCHTENSFIICCVFKYSKMQQWFSGLLFTCHFNKKKKLFVCFPNILIFWNQNLLCIKTTTTTTTNKETNKRPKKKKVVN